VSTATSPELAAGRAGGHHPGVHPKLALAVIAVAQLMVVLDVTIVNIALPHMQSALHFSRTGLAWVLNAYTLTFGGLLLVGGRAGDLFGRRRVFVTGVLLFSIASLAGGFAWDKGARCRVSGARSPPRRPSPSSRRRSRRAPNATARSASTPPSRVPARRSG
jgi:hypothetical protein